MSLILILCSTIVQIPTSAAPYILVVHHCPQTKHDSVEELEKIRAYFMGIGILIESRHIWSIHMKSATIVRTHFSMNIIR